MVEGKNFTAGSKMAEGKCKKIFCVGCNKTGTSSLLVAMQALGYQTAPQPAAEPLLDDWFKGDVSPILKFVQSVEEKVGAAHPNTPGIFFQDVPFSLPHLYTLLDKHFPNSKFILTVRDDAHQWWRSITHFHANFAGIKPPLTEEQLRKVCYRYKGWLWKFMQLYGALPGDPYNQGSLIKHYETHNAAVIEYFASSTCASTQPLTLPNLTPVEALTLPNLLVLNVKVPNAVARLCNFLGVDGAGKLKEMPWVLKTLYNAETRCQAKDPTDEKK